MQKWTQRFGLGLLGGLVALFIILAVSPHAQSFVIGYFSRIYLGSTSGSQIRWGSADPALPCVPGSLYAQKTSSTVGDVWKCTPIDTGEAPSWTRVAGQIRIGDDFYATQFGALCDGTTDDTTAIQDTIDAAYAFAEKAGRVMLPAGTCATTGIQFGPVTTPWQVPATDPLNQVGCVMDFTAGDSTNFTIVSGCTLEVGHVGKALTFAVPLNKSTIDFAGGALLQPGPPGGDNHWFKYFLATITSRLTAATGTMTIVGLQSGSFDVRQFPDLPHASGCVNLPSGVPDTGCIASYYCHQHYHLQAACSPEALLDSQYDDAAYAVYQAGHGGTGHLFPYAFPLDTDQRFIHLKGASEAVTLLRWIGNTTKLPVIAFSKNKYFTAENVGVFNASGSSPDASAALAGLGAGNVNNGAHSYRIACTYALTIGTWGGAGSVTVVNNAADGQVTVSTPVCSDNTAGDAATARTLYRSKAGFASLGPWYLLDTIANNVATTYTDNIADSSLTTQGFSYGNAIGIYLGGLPGAGTQTLVSTLRNIQSGNQGTGFRYGVLLGDNLGGESSEIRFERLSIVGNNTGAATAPGGFNVLDIFFDQLTGGFNQVGIETNSGNVMITNGSFSFNGVDFYGRGFGPTSIRGFRTEGPGRVYYGQEPITRIEEIHVAEPQGARVITGNVTATPDNIRTETIDVTSTTCPQQICPIIFAAGDVTGQDPRKLVVLPGLGVAGADIIATINSVTTTTAGTVQVLSGTMTSTGAVAATIYETNTADLTFPSGQVVANDIGGAFKLPEAAVPGAWNGNAVQVYLTEWLTATTGKGFFYSGSNGAGPVDPAGGTTTNPTFFDRTVIEITSGEYQYGVHNFTGNGRVFITGNGGGGMSLVDSTILSVESTLLDTVALPVRFRSPGVHFDIDPYTSVPTSSTTTGILFSTTATDNTNNAGSSDGNFTLYAQDTRSQFFAGPLFHLADTTVRWRGNTATPLDMAAKASVGTATGNFYYQNYPFDPVAPQRQYSLIKEFSEAPWANGRNLRQLCTFATSATSTCTFERTVAYTFNSDGTGGTISDPATSMVRVLVASGAANQMDVGKTITFPACCGEFAAIALGAADMFGTIIRIFDATHFDVRIAQGRRATSFPNGTTAGNSTIGQDEPDALWRPALWGCSGLDTANNEVVTITSWTAAQVVLTSSNVASVAQCLVGVVR